MSHKRDMGEFMVAIMISVCVWWVLSKALATREEPKERIRTVYLIPEDTKYQCVCCGCQNEMHFHQDSFDLPQ